MKIRDSLVKFGIVSISLLAVFLVYLSKLKLASEEESHEYPLFLERHSITNRIPKVSRVETSLLDTNNIEDPFHTRKEEPVEEQKAEEGITLSDYLLSAIIMGKEGEPVAVINDTVLSTGDHVGELRIKGILRDRVICEARGKEYTLELRHEMKEGAVTIEIIE